MNGLPAAGASPFSWSLSRHDSFMSCKRRYFYAYYEAQVDPEVKRLKKLSALPLWAGSVVHETIEQVLKTHDTMPSPEVQEAIVREAVHGAMLGQWRESEAGGPEAAGAAEIEPGALRFRLFEHEYQVPVDADDKKIVVGTVMRSLRNFFRSDTLREAYAVGRGQWLTVEDLVSFTVEGVDVMLRMDLAYRRPDGRVLIVDWKTGRGQGRFNEVQLAGYALYAAHAGWAASAEEIRTELAYLALPRYVQRAVDARKLDHARAFIAKSARNMRSLLLDPVANLARLEEFPMEDRPQRCRRCNFRRLCFPRVEPLAADAPAATA
jgi:CRISPR/Cas system-associated exonuclease Cas4 (RecB family)